MGVAAPRAVGVRDSYNQMQERNDGARAQNRALVRARSETPLNSKVIGHGT